MRSSLSATGELDHGTCDVRLIGCSNCGALQQARAEAAPIVSCSVCRSLLERTTWRSLPAALACASSVFLLLIPANLLPFLTTSVLGVSRQSRLISSATAMWGDGWAFLAVLIGLFVVVLPIVRFGVLTAVLGMLQLGRRPAWLGRGFRLANALQQWAMPDVFLLGLWVAYARLSSTISVQLGAGAVCFIGAGALSLFTRASLDKGAIWRRIEPDWSQPLGEATCSCLSCDLVVPAAFEDKACPRCSAKISARAPDSVARAIAMTLAGVIFYIPANLYAIATLPIGLTPTRYTVLQGVIDLAQAKLLGLALLVF
jgi:paraquat-inducible protein A